MLRALGLVRRQVAGAFLTEALVLVGSGLVVGIPLGIAAGRLAWSAFVDRLGTGGGADLPVGQLVTVCAAALVLAVLLALVPAVGAARRPPSTTLRVP